MKPEKEQVDKLDELWRKWHGSKLQQLKKEADVFAEYLWSLQGFEITDAQPYEHVGEVIVDGVLQVGNDFEKQVKTAVERIGKFPEAATVSGFMQLLNKHPLGVLINFKTDRVKYELLRAARFFASKGVNTVEQLFDWLKHEQHRDELLTIKHDPQGTKFSVGDKTADYFRKLVGHCDAVAVDQKGIIPLLKEAGIRKGSYKEKRTIVQLAAISHFNCSPIDLDESIYQYYKANRKGNKTRKQKRKEAGTACTNDYGPRNETDTSQSLITLPAGGKVMVEATNRDTWGDNAREICIDKGWTACLVCWGGPLDLSIVEKKYNTSWSYRGKQPVLWIPIKLWIVSTPYAGKLRYCSMSKDSCISNHLEGGFKLGQAMTDAGFVAREKIHLKVVGNEVHVLKVK